MAIEAPQTYAEWYWSNSVEATNYVEELREKAQAPFIAQTIDTLHLRELMGKDFEFYLDLLEHPPAPEFADLQRTFMSILNRVAEVVSGGQTAKSAEYRDNAYFHVTQIDANMASLLKQHKKITDEFFDTRMLNEGYAKEEALHFYNSQIPYPSIPEVIHWARYKGDYDNIRIKLWEKYDVPVDDIELWEWLGLQKPTTEQTQALFKRGKLTETEFTSELGKIGWHNTDRDYIKDLAYQIPNAMLLVQGGLIQDLSTDIILKDIQIADIHPEYSQKYLDAILTKPASIDIVSYELRKDPKLTNLGNELQRIGIHPNYHKLYKELAYQIPPVADIITMAVREAFTPDIAARFGQYEDLPTPYVEWVQKKGLSKEWAERYWAAHWSLPSPQQGFEMLHRGIITKDELNLLLRALDIMPFWRDKLIQMSYRPLTRVDVRRMYRVGTLDERGIKKAYRDVGYSDTNADLMADFTVRQTRQTLSAFSSRDIIKAYTKRFIDDSKARSLLRNLGIRDAEIQNIITTANYKRNWAFKTERIDAIENLYKKGRITDIQARSQLENLDLPSDHIQILLQQWMARIDEPKMPLWTTAQTLKFLSTKLISQERAIAELKLLGYNAERIGVYIRSIQSE